MDFTSIERASNGIYFPAFPQKYDNPLNVVYPFLVNFEIYWCNVTFEKIKVTQNVMQRSKIDICKVHLNEGQIEGLPRNPRLIKDGKFKKLCKSIQSLPEMTEARDILVYPHNGEYIVIGGNQRLHVYRHLGWQEVSCCILPEDMPIEKLRQMLIQDNNPFGENDWDILANEWDSEELEDWGFDVWQEPKKEKAKSVKEQQDEQESEKPDFFAAMLGDHIYDSNNEFDIPNLRIDRQPNSGLLLPFAGWEKSPAKHKPEELEAARILADKGYKVTLKNESGMSKTPDGYLFTASFEQRTPQGNSAKNIRASLYHGRDKKADVPVLYMKGNGHTRKSVEDGIKYFESLSKYRFKEIIIVTQDGRIHRHKHNS